MSALPARECSVACAEMPEARWVEGPAARRLLLRGIPSGLYVVGLPGPGEPHAFTASWLSQVSIEPPAVVLGVRRGSRALCLVRPGSALTVNFIAREDVATARAFLRPRVDSGPQLAGFAHRSTAQGAPILERAIGWLECEVRAVVDGFGDHAAVIAGVRAARAREGAEPLRLADTPWHYGG